MEESSSANCDTQCQYFVLSPRRSANTPSCSLAENDENTDPNFRSGAQHVIKAAAKGLKSPTSQQRSSRSLTPSPAITPHVMSLPMTPERDGHEPSSALDTSCESRWTQLSRRSSLRRHPSSKELEEMEVEQKRREVHELIRRNRVSCHRALNAVDSCSAGRAASRPMKMTVPKEFSLSAPPTPRSPPASASPSESEEDTLRSRSLSAKATPARKPPQTKPWRPQLTVPKPPELHTTRRLSACGTGRLSKAPSDDVDSQSRERSTSTVKTSPVRAGSRPKPSPTRPCTPERCGLEVYTAFTRAQRQAAGGFRSAGTQQHEAVGATPVISRKGARAQERAEHARQLVQQKKDEEARAAQEKVCIFRKSGILVNPPPDWDAFAQRSDSTLRREPLSARGLEPRQGFGSSAERHCMRCTPRSAMPGGPTSASGEMKAPQGLAPNSVQAKHRASARAILQTN